MNQEQIVLALRAALYALNTIPKKRINFTDELKDTYAVACLLEKTLRDMGTKPYVLE